jgi:hypothetical protein
MAPQRISRMHRLLLFVSVFVGLFLMHGVQATPSPVQAAGAMVGAASHAHSAASPVSGAMAVATADPAVSAFPDCPGGHCGDGHLGAVCFALLVLAGLMLLVAAVRSLPRPTTPTGRHLLFARRGPPRARAPNVYQLSALRL